MITNSFDKSLYVITSPLAGRYRLYGLFSFPQYDIFEFGQISHGQIIVSLGKRKRPSLSASTDLTSGPGFQELGLTA